LAWVVVSVWPFPLTRLTPCNACLTKKTIPEKCAVSYLKSAQQWALLFQVELVCKVFNDNR
jgi:hypothetical protein